MLYVATSPVVWIVLTSSVPVTDPSLAAVQEMNCTVVGALISQQVGALCGKQPARSRTAPRPCTQQQCDAWTEYPRVIARAYPGT